jgi:hypothetical protein
MENRATASAHTAGPWIVANRNEICADNEHESLVAEVFDETDQWRANARLIASAPDLLEACKAAVFALNQIPSRTLHPMVGVHKTTYSICSLLDAVIQKAEGPALCVKCGTYPRDAENNNEWCRHCIADLPL